MDIQKWNIEALIDACSEYPKGNKKLIIPKFQRRREWKKEQEDELIETMKLNNISIGALQLFHLDNIKKMDKYLLVDGLHRCSTLTKYYNNPFEFGTTKTSIANITKELQEKYGKTYGKNELEKMCNTWMCVEMLGKYDEFVVEKTFVEKFDEIKAHVKCFVDKNDVDNISKLLLAKTKELAKEVDISKTSIPIILNTGDMKHLATLFKRLNQNGTPLKPCDILAAKWYDAKKIEIRNVYVVEEIKNHYKELKSENNNMEIYVDDDGKLFGAYEYIVGLKRYIFKKYTDETFINKITDKEIMFKILACCFYGDISKKSIEKLKDKLSTEKLSDVEEKLDWAISFIVDVFDEVVTLKCEKKTKLLVKDVPFYVAMIALAFKSRSRLEKNADLYKGLFRMNLLSDKLADTSFNAKIIRSIIEDKKYMNFVDKKEFEERINKFIVENNKQHGKRDKLSNVSLLVLSMLNEDNENVDVCNIVEKKVLKKLMESEDESLSMNGLGNMCVYPLNEEKRKPSQNVYTYLSSSGISDDSIYKNYMFVEENPDNDDIIIKQEIIPKYYNDFLKKRTSKIKQMISDKYKKCFKNSKDKDDITDNESESDSDNKSESDSDNESYTESESEKSVKTNKFKSSKSDSESDDDGNSDSSNESDSDESDNSDGEYEKPKKIIKKSGNRTIIMKK